MGNIEVDQIGADGHMVSDVDHTLTESQKDDLLLQALPGSRTETYAGVRVVRIGHEVIFKKQVTYLGHPHPLFKKRIQIPKSWITAYHQAHAEGLVPRFVGIYHHRGVTIFVDFDPSTYVWRKANNSAAHVATNDLHQAQVLGIFSRDDRNNNHFTSVRADQFAAYLRGAVHENHPYLDVFDAFNREFLIDQRIEALDAVQEMHRRAWPDTFQGEWPGFYLESRVDEFLRRTRANDLIEFHRVKGQGLDYDLVFKNGQETAFYGDLKASDLASIEAPGNDAEDIRRTLEDYDRFWYVLYEHETWHSRDEGNAPVIAWNEWKRSVGYDNRKPYNELSYARRFKSAVRFSRMRILEVNRANSHVVLGDFAQGRQPDGSSRALKVMISKRNIDNFLLYSA